MTAEPSSVPSDAPTAVPPTVLTPELLQGIRDRAADYDARNAFFFDDLDELRAAAVRLRGRR